MCEKCNAFDAKIERYRLLSGWVRDRIALTTKTLSDKLQVQKATLHPEREPLVPT